MAKQPMKKKVPSPNTNKKSQPLSAKKKNPPPKKKNPPAKKKIPPKKGKNPATKQKKTPCKIKILYNGSQLILTNDSQRVIYPLIKGNLSSGVEAGVYMIKPSEVSVKSWGLLPFTANTYTATTSSLWRTMEPNVFKQESLEFKLYSSDGAMKSLQSFYVYGSQFLDSFTIKFCPISPFTAFAANLRLAASNCEQVPILINSKKANNLNLEALVGHIPDNVIVDIQENADKYEITNNTRLAFFLGQMAVESNFKGKSEDLTYKSEDRIVEIFGRNKCVMEDDDGNPLKDKKGNFKRSLCFPTKESAKPYVSNPQKLGNYVYAFKNGNEDEESGEGYQFRGRGGIQLTGKSNYESFSEYVEDPNIMNNPDLVNTKYPISSAAYYFDQNHLWSIPDGATKRKLEDSVNELTQAVNRRMVDSELRITKTKEYLRLLGVELTN